MSDGSSSSISWLSDLIIKPTYINTTQNVADAMTKPMDKKHVLAFTPAMYGVRK